MITLSRHTKTILARIALFVALAALAYGLIEPIIEKELLAIASHMPASAVSPKSDARLFSVALLAVVAALVVIFMRAGNRKQKSIRLPGINNPRELSEKHLSVKQPLLDSQNLQIGIDRQTGEIAAIPEASRTLHTLVAGPTGSGKSGSVLTPMIKQDLARIRMGEPACICVLEPKGDLIEDIADICDGLQLPYVRIDPALVRQGKQTGIFNPLEGPEESVVVIMQSILKSLAGSSGENAFFSDVGWAMSGNVLYMAKRLHGDNIDMLHVKHLLQNFTDLQAEFELYKRYLIANGIEDDEVKRYFEWELFNGNSKTTNDLRSFAQDLRNQFEKLTDNPILVKTICGESSINLDQWLSSGGILLVNTDMGDLADLGDTFGKFVLMHLTKAIFRRSREARSIPLYLYVDELPRYRNENIEELLALSRSFGCACTFAIQSSSQLIIGRDQSLRNIIVGNCRNKIIFGQSDANDAKYWSEQLGKERTKATTKSFDRHGPFQSILPKSESVSDKDEDRFSPAALMDLPRYWFIAQYITEEGLARPRICSPVPWWQTMPPIDSDAKRRIQEEILKQRQRQWLHGSGILDEKSKQQDWLLQHQDLLQGQQGGQDRQDRQEEEKSERAASDVAEKLNTRFSAQEEQKQGVIEKLNQTFKAEKQERSDKPTIEQLMEEYERQKNQQPSPLFFEPRDDDSLDIWGLKKGEPDELQKLLSQPADELAKLLNVKEPQKKESNRLIVFTDASDGDS